MAHVLIRNRNTKAVWACPESVVDAALDQDNPFLGRGWAKAAKDAEPTDEAPVVASRDNKEN